MNYFLISLNYLLMVIIPIVLAILIRRKTSAPWRLFFIGATTFILSQVLHIPFNWAISQTGLIPTDLTVWSNLLVSALFLGLSAGVFEETARYLTYRFWAKDARTWTKGLMLGAGHGGIEAIILGLLAGINFIGLIIVSSNDALLSTIPADQRSLVVDALTEINNLPWYGLLLGAVERIFAITAHLAMSLMVMQVFTRGNILWLLAAIGFHTLLNAVAVISVVQWGPYVTEGLLAILALISLAIIFKLRTPEPPAQDTEPLAKLPPVEAVILEPTDDAIERSRYS